VQDAEDNAVRDGLIQAAADAQQARDEAERAAREAARARLMAEVDAIRQQQIADKVGTTAGPEVRRQHHN
jgi:purine nucleoside phosphorylase